MAQIPLPSWENQNIALLSSNPNPLSEEITGRLERRGWHFLVKTNRIPEAFKAVSSGICSMLVVEGTPELPAGMVLRAQITQPMVIIAPTIVINHLDHKHEALMLKDIGFPELLSAPIAPADFIARFEWVIRRWNQGNLRKLILARQLFIDKQYLVFSKVLSNIRDEPEIQPLLTPCTAQILLNQSDFKGVEKLLLGSLKDHPKNMGIILSLIEFYLRASMPETALKVIAASRKNHSSSKLLLCEQVQAQLMLGQIRECIPLLENLIRENYCRELATKFLARCFYAEGYKDRFQKYLAEKNYSIEDFSSRWNKVAG